MVNYDLGDPEIDKMLRYMHGTTVDDTAERVIPEPIAEDILPEEPAYYDEPPQAEELPDDRYEPLFDGDRRWPATIPEAPRQPERRGNSGRVIGGLVLSLLVAGGGAGVVLTNHDNGANRSATIQPTAPEHTKHRKHRQNVEPSASPTEDQTQPSKPEKSEKLIPFTLQDPSPDTQPSDNPSSPEPSWGEAGTGKTITLKVFNANALGAAHTSKHGNKPRYAGYVKRTHLLGDVLKENDVDFGAVQEFEKPQKRVFKKDSGKTYAFFPHTRKGREIVFWKRKLCSAVSTKMIKMPYFNGKPHKYPIVELRCKDPSNPEVTQDFFVWSIHNPANLKRLHRSQKPYQAIATRVQKKEVKRLQKKFKKPVFVLGDANEKAGYYCTMTENGRLQSAIPGGSNGPNELCKPPKGLVIDHILGGPAKSVKFSNYEVHDGAWVRNMTDHGRAFTADATMKVSDR